VEALVDVVVFVGDFKTNLVDAVEYGESEGVEDAVEYGETEGVDENESEVSDAKGDDGNIAVETDTNLEDVVDMVEVGDGGGHDTGRDRNLSETIVTSGS